MSLLPNGGGRKPAADAGHDEPQPLRPAYPTFHRFAAVQAVLPPLCELKAVSFPPRPDTVRALQALWRVRLSELRDAGWQPIQRPRDFAYAANCPPLSFARDGSDHRPCNKYRVCPFCHGLRASLLYENILRAVRSQRQPLDLYLLVSVLHLPAEDLDDALRHLARFEKRLLAGWAGVLVAERRRQDGDLDDGTLRWRVHLEWLAQLEKWVASWAGPSGILTRAAVSPARKGNGLVRVRHVALLALPAGARPPRVVAERGVRVRQDDLSLARTAANLASYPVGLLYEPADATARLLESLADRHLGTARGIFRSALAARSIEQCRGQRVAPPVRPKLPDVCLVEEERVVSRLPVSAYPHERLAARSLLARLGLPAGAADCKRAALPLPVHWLGVLEYTVEEFFRRPKRLRPLFKPHRHEGDHALVYVAPGRGYFAFSTLGLSAVGLPDEGCAAERWFGKRLYVVEPLAQLAWRLRAWRPDRAGPAGVTIAG
jgi:hypothetical protein